MYLYNQSKKENDPFPTAKEKSRFVIDAIDTTPRRIVPLDHAKSYVVLDILVRFLEYQGYTVRYIQNLPHNNDQNWAAYFKDEVEKLNIRLPEIEPFEVDLAVKAFDHSRDEANLQFYIDRDATVNIDAKKAVLVRLYKPGSSTVDAKVNQAIGSLLSTRMFLERCPLNALRIYLAQHHYRDRWSYDSIGLERAARSAEKIDTAIAALSHSGGPHLNSDPAERRFFRALGRDLDGFAATAALLNLADDILFKAPSGYDVSKSKEALLRLGSILGLQFEAVAMGERGTVFKSSDF